MRASSSLDPPSSILLLLLCRNQRLQSLTSRRVRALTSSRLELFALSDQSSFRRVRPREVLKDSSFERKIGRSSEHHFVLDGPIPRENVQVRFGLVLLGLWQVMLVSAIFSIGYLNMKSCGTVIDQVPENFG